MTLSAAARGEPLTLHPAYPRRTSFLDEVVMVRVAAGAPSGFKRGWVVMLGLLLGVFGLVSAAWADPPGRVGRLAEATGAVWLFSPSTGEWVTAPLNRPITTADRLSTDPGARAVLRIGSTVLRLDGASELEFVTVDDDRIRVQLHAGSVALRVRNPEKISEIELLSAEGRFALQRAGRYRMDRADAATSVTVWSGQGIFEGRGSAQTLFARQRGDFWLDPRLGPNLQYSLVDPMLDAFSGWVASRDLQDDRLASARYVSPEMTGVEDLDLHGRWEETADYGAVWVPRGVPPGWAPYRFGRWAWVSPWGWTWIDDAPWGFAPFHYGRWVWYRDAWGWTPGRWVARPVYAPALVAWIGGSHFGVGVQIGAAPPVGWFPLAPFEPFVPWYGVSPRYVQGINSGHVTQVDPRLWQSPDTFVGRFPYANRFREPAVTVVPGGTLVGRQPVAPAAGAWIQDPSIRGTVYDPGRGTGVVADPGWRQHLPRPAIVIPPAPRLVAGPGGGGGGSQPLPPVGAIEPDRRMHIPDRIPRSPPPDPSGGFVQPSAAVPAYRPPSGVDAPGAWNHHRGRPDAVVVPPSFPPAVVAPPVVRPPPTINTAPVENAAQRIGREPLPQIGRPEPPAPVFRAPPSPMVIPERVHSSPPRVQMPTAVPPQRVERDRDRERERNLMAR
jgi:hypothetical protein